MRTIGLNFSLRSPSRGWRTWPTIASPRRRPNLRDHRQRDVDVLGAGQVAAGADEGVVVETSRMPAAGTSTSSSRIVVSGSLRWPPPPAALGCGCRGRCGRSPPPPSRSRPRRRRLRGCRRPGRRGRCRCARPGSAGWSWLPPVRWLPGPALVGLVCRRPWFATWSLLPTLVLLAGPGRALVAGRSRPGHWSGSVALALARSCCWSRLRSRGRGLAALGRRLLAEPSRRGLLRAAPCSAGRCSVGARLARLGAARSGRP